MKLFPHESTAFETRAPRTNKISSFRAISSNLLLILVAVLSIQLIGKVFAMAFTLSSSTSESDETEQVVAGDFDGDGDIDYISFNDDASEDYILYSNNGSGTFSASTITKTADNFVRAGVGDIDDDGDLDFVTADDSGDDLYRYLNNGSGVFTQTTIATSLTPDAIDIVLMDVDNDGDQDIVYASSAGNVTQAVYLNNGHGVFSATSSTLPSTAEYLAAADLDSDGDLDIMQGFAATSYIFKNSGTGAFTLLSSPGVSGGSRRPIFSDVDGDGDIDILMAGASDGKIYSYLNNGLGTSFTSGTEFGGVNTPRHAAVGDLDTDGDFDVIIGGFDSGGSNAGNEIWLNDGSATFTQSGTPTEESDCTNFVSVGDIDADGDLDYIAGNAGCSSGSQVNRHYTSDQAATSANTTPSAPSTGFGATFFRGVNSIVAVDTTADMGIRNSLAIGTDDLPVIVSVRDTGTDELVVTKCGNANCSAGNTTTVVANPGFLASAVYTSVAIGSDGFPIIAFLDNTGDDLKVIHCGNEACSSGNTTTTLETTGQTGQYNSIAIGDDDLAIISYHNNTSGDLKVVKCGNTACSSGNTINTIESTNDVGSSTSIIMGADGLPVISYEYGTDGDIRVAKCGNADCSSGNTITTVDATDQLGLFNTSIALGADDFPIVSYYDNTNDDLKVTKCGNAACSSGNTTSIVDSSGDPGLYSSIAVPDDGLPVISYFDDSADDLRITKCGNAACSSGNTTTTIQASQAAGMYTALGIGGDGFPVIAYRFFTTSTNDLYVLKCNDAACANIATDGRIAIRLAWGSGSDTHTATRLLQYQLKMGTGTSTQNIMSGRTSSPNYVTRLMPNGQSRNFLFNTTTCNSDVRYYWSVAAVDSGFRQSSWSTEQSFTIEDDCSITDHTGGGTSGGSGTSGGTTGGSTSAGGGLPWSVIRQSWQSSQVGGSLLGGGGGLSLLPLTVSLLNDVTGDGKQTSREQPLFLSGLPVTAVGTALDGTIVRSTVLLGRDGKATFKLPPSDKDGYIIYFDPTHPSLTGYIPTQGGQEGQEGQERQEEANSQTIKPVNLQTSEQETSSVSSSVPPEERIPEGMHTLPPLILDSPTETTTTIALRREDLLAYTPCLTIGDRASGELRGSDSFTLLQRLKDPYGKRIMEGISFSETLMTRKDFFLLLGRSQCTPQITNRNFLEGRLREASTTKNITLPLVDLPINTKDPTSLMIYSMIADGADITRRTPKGYALDPQSPITRAEVIRALYSTLHIPKDRQIDPAAFIEEEEPQEVSSRTFLAFLIEPAEAQGLNNLRSLLRRSSSSSSAATNPIQNLLNSINERLLRRTSSSSSAARASSSSSASITTTTTTISSSSTSSLSVSSQVSSLSSQISSVSSSETTSSASSESSLSVSSVSTSSSSSSSTSSSVSSSLSSSRGQEGQQETSSSTTSTSSENSSTSSSQSSSLTPQTSSESSSASSEPLTLPDDLSPESPLSKEFLTLLDLGILPKNFSTFFGENQGIDTSELATMIARAAFRNGKIDMLPPIGGQQRQEEQHSAAPLEEEETFLDLLPNITVPSCLKKSSTRPPQITFTDLFPGDPSYPDLKELHSYYLQNSLQETLWLLPATRRPTEFGIEKGQTTLAKTEPLSILETLRTLLILTCTPPDTAATLRLNALPTIQGSAETRVPKDRLSGLPRDSSFASRILFKAQDHQTFLDLSLFTFAPTLLRAEDTRSPASGLSVLEASELLSSSFLNLALHQDLLSLEEAQNLSQELSLALLKEMLTFTDIQEFDLERDSITLKTIPFTREMLLQILREFFFPKDVTALDSTTPTTPSPIRSIGEGWPAIRSLGEEWWERVG